MTMVLTTNVVSDGIALLSSPAQTTSTIGDDLNLTRTLQTAASKFLTKRNVIKGSQVYLHQGSKAAGAAAAAAATADIEEFANQQPEFLPLSGGSGSMSQTIAGIRANVSRVLHVYFRNVTTTNDEYDNEILLSSPKLEAGGQPQQQQQQKQHNTFETSKTWAAATSATPRNTVGQIASTITSGFLENSNILNNNISSPTSSKSAHLSAMNAIDDSPITNLASYNHNNNNVISTAITHLSEVMVNATAPALESATSSSTSAVTTLTNRPELFHNITYPSYGIAITSYENCSALFANYTPTPAHQGLFCNFTWDMFLCWPPTPAGVLAHMSCPAGFHGVDARKFANRKCELNGLWGGRPNETTHSPNGWTDYHPCFNQEVQDLFRKVPNIELVVAIAKRTRTLEIVGLILSLVALILSLIIFCNFRTLRNNRTKIHKNLFIAMVLQVVIRLSLYLDQAFRRDKTETMTNASLSSIENTPYLCEASYVLLEYAKTAMFMWMFIEGWYLHNMVTVTVFQGRFPYKLYSLVGWGVPVLMTKVWAVATAFHYADTMHVCWWNYNLTPYYWILEGPRIVIITINFAFLLNIIRVLVMKLRESQASDIEQTRKAVRAAIVLLPLLGTINVLYLIPALETPWKFALWSYVTHFLNTFQGFFIALIYCFLNGEVRAVLLKSLATYMSVRGHPEWVPKRASMYSAGYNTAQDTENQNDNKRNESAYPKHLNGRKASCTTVIHHHTNPKTPKTQILQRHSNSAAAGQSSNYNHLQTPLQSNNHHHHQHQPSHYSMQHLGSGSSNNNNHGGSSTSLPSLGRNHHHQQQQQQHQHQLQQLPQHTSNNPQQQHQHPYVHHRRPRHSWMLTLCFRGQKNKCVMSNNEMPPKIFIATKMETFT